MLEREMYVCWPHSYKTLARAPGLLLEAGQERQEDQGRLVEVAAERGRRRGQGLHLREGGWMDGRGGGETCGGFLEVFRIFRKCKNII